MEILVKKVSIDEVEPGMYLEDVFNGRGDFLLSANTLVVTSEQIQNLKLRGIKTVHVNTAKGKDVSRKGVPNAASLVSRGTEWLPEPKASYHEELPKAREVRRQTWETARKVLSSIKWGGDFETGGVEEMAGEIVKSILRNPDALVSLCQIKGHDEYTYVHSVNVGVLMTSLAHEMGYTEDQLLTVGMGGVLHDIGKMRVPEAILNKPGKYADWEFEIMKKHPKHGIDIVKDHHDVPDSVRTIIVQHHERYNGSGYPSGLRGDAIDETAVVAAVADVYDALTSDRVYRAAWTPQKAIATIFQGCDEQYARRVVELFTRRIGVFPVGSFVRLGTGEMGVVVKTDEERLLAPQIAVLFGRKGIRLREPVRYDLSEKQKGPEGPLYKIEVSLNPKAYRVDVARYLDKGEPNLALTHQGK